MEDKVGTQVRIQGTLVDRLLRQAKRGEAELPSSEGPAPEPVKEIAPDLLTTKRAEVKFPGDAATRFSQEILDAYVVDHRLTEAEKRAYYRATPDAGDRIRVPGTDILIRGAKQYDPDELPIGDDKTRVDEWTDALVLTMADVIAKDTLFASLGKDGKFTVSKLKKVSETQVVRDYSPASRSYRTTTCGTGAHSKDVMLAVAKQIDRQGVGVPATVTTVGDICVYSELLAREQHACIWFTPEEFSVLYDDPEVSKRIVAEFKKTKPS
jgi:hypothetical protein